MEMHELMTTAEILRRLQKNSTALFIVMVGPPGSGKSTLAHEICRFYDVRRFSTDEKLEILHKHGVLNEKSFPKIPFGNLIRKMKFDIWQHANMGKGVLIDQTSMTEESRSFKIEWAPPHFYKVCIDCTGLTVDQMDLRVRDRVARGGRHIPRHRIADMVRAYEPPALSEGFDLIIRLQQ
jgi:predicted ABC-type ATPase